MEICYEELAHTIMEAGESQELLSTSWRPRKGGGVIQCKSKVLGTRGANGVSPSPRAKEHMMRCSISCNEAEKQGADSSFLQFCSVQALNRWGDAHLHW